MSNLVLKKIKCPDFLLIKIKKNFMYWTVWFFSPGKIIMKKLKVYSLMVVNNTLLLFYDKRKLKDIMLFRTQKTLIENIFFGSVIDYSRILEVYGVGYTLKLENNVLELNLGYSHKIFYKVPPFLKVSVLKKTISVSGCDIHKVMQVCCILKNFKKLDAYKGKGVRFLNESIILKEAKKSK